MVNVHLTIVTAHLVVLHQTAVVHRTERNVEVGLLATTSHVDFVVLRSTVLQEQVAPVGVRTIIIDIQCSCTIVELFCQHSLRSNTRKYGIIGIQSLVALCPILVSALVNQTLHLLVAIHRMCGIGSAIERVVEVEAHRCSASLTTLGGDDDDTIGTTGTIDSGRRCILQYLHRLNVGWVDVEGRTVCHTIHENQRIIGSQHRTGTTKIDAHSRTRLTTALLQVHARNLCLHRLHRIRRSYILQVIRLDRSHGTREVAFLNDTIADDNQLIQRVVVLFHYNRNSVLTTYLHRLFLISNIRKLNDGRWLDAIERKITIQISN